MTDSISVDFNFCMSLSLFAYQSLSKWQQALERRKSSLSVISWTNPFLLLTPTFKEHAHHIDGQSRRLPVNPLDSGYFAIVLSLIICEDMTAHV